MSDEYIDPFTHAHPAFREAFRGDLYSDATNEFAPFGSDEGADLLADTVDRRHLYGPQSTVRNVLSDDGTEDVDSLVAEAEAVAPDLDGSIIAAGFALLLLTGQIDQEGLGWTRDALQRTHTEYQNPESATMLADLDRFTASRGSMGK